jgi:hypothetical protein
MTPAPSSLHTQHHSHIIKYILDTLPSCILNFRSSRSPQYLFSLRDLFAQGLVLNILPTCLSRKHLSVMPTTPIDRREEYRDNGHHQRNSEDCKCEYPRKTVCEPAWVGVVIHDLYEDQSHAHGGEACNY